MEKVKHQHISKGNILLVEKVKLIKTETLLGSEDKMPYMKAMIHLFNIPLSVWYLKASRWFG